MATIRIANYSPFPSTAWRRTTVSHPINGPLQIEVAGQIVRVVPARPVGESCQAVDVFCSLAPGQEIAINVAAGIPCVFYAPPLPGDLATHFGGMVSVSGTQMRLVEATAEGAAMRAKLQARLSTSDPNAWAFVQGELLFYPELDSVVHAEFAVTACGAAPTMPVDADLRLAWGDAIAMVHGASADGIILRQGNRLGRGQLCWYAVTFAWPRHIGKPGENASAMAALHNGIGAAGLDGTLIEGAPLFPPGLDARSWCRTYWAESWRQLHTWERSGLGPERYSGQTGRQEVQLHHCGGEALLPGGVGAEMIRLASAMHTHGKWPFHHREIDGSHVDERNHPNLKLFAGQPHWHTGVSPDQLGYLRPLIPGDANGFDGPGPQHWYATDLAAAALLTGSRMAQVVLRDHAHAYLLSTTLNPSSSLYGPEGARTWGVWATLVLGLWQSLDDRDLAQRVVERLTRQLIEVYVAGIRANELSRGYPIWSVITNDPRVVPPGVTGAHWWQEAFSAGAVYRFARHFGGMEAAMDAAVKCARFVLDRAWHLIDQGNPSERWHAQSQGPIDGSWDPASPFNDFGHPMGVWCVLQANPNDAKARSIWAELMSSTGETAFRWMLPWRDPNGLMTTDKKDGLS